MIPARSSRRYTISSRLVLPTFNKNGVEGGTFLRRGAGLVPRSFCPPRLESRGLVGKMAIRDCRSQGWIEIERVNGGSDSWRWKAPNRSLWKYKLGVVILSICDDRLCVRPRHVNVELRLCVRIGEARPRLPFRIWIYRNHSELTCLLVNPSIVGLWGGMISALHAPGVGVVVKPAEAVLLYRLRPCLGIAV